jgi:tRNA threonylcarbamoyladenosine modification (KEOPS) complex  Pcc1 subunit
MPEGRGWDAVVTVPGLSRDKAEMAYRALLPEMGDVAGKSVVSLEREGEELRLHVHADSIPALRAALNAYLRWLIMVDRVGEIALRSDHPE